MKTKRRGKTARIPAQKTLKRDENRRFVKRMAIRADGESALFIGLRRAYILPTQKGLYYVLTLAVMFVWSINYALSLGYALSFFTAVLALLLAVLTVNNLTAIRVTPLHNTNFFAGEPAFFRVQIDNEKQDPCIAVRGRRNGLFSAPVTMLGEAHAVLEIPLDDNSRGRKTLDYLHLSGEYPIGIFRAWTWVYFPAPLLIYPRPVGDLPLPFLPEHHGFDEGQVDWHGSEDFNDLRDYQPGDNLRHIAWKKATVGQVRVKTFQDLAGQECILDFNDETLAHLDTEARLSQLCQWVLAAESQGTKYALRLPGQSLGQDFAQNFSQGQAHKTACLEALACY